jgi:nonribosomal peptide synthetase DhbF
MRPLFCIHHAGGFSWPYSRLLRHIPPENPIYGVQARNLMQREALPESVHDMASDYLSLIRAVQPEGPYNLLGWSFGGLVAHEIATRLQDEGEEVAILALLDSYPRVTSPDGIANSPDSEVLYAGVADNSIRNMLDLLRREGHVHSELTEEQYAAIMAVFENNVRLMRNYAPRRYNGDVSLFVATEGEPPPPNDIWKPFVAGRIKVHQIACAHDNMMDPLPAAKIGEVLAAELENQSPTRNMQVTGGHRDDDEPL